MSMASFPELYDAMLTWERIDALLTDIDAVGELLEILLKDGPTAHARPAEPDLLAARAALAAGSSMVQIRYRHGGDEWWDTLVPAAGGARLLRVRR